LVGSLQVNRRLSTHAKFEMMIDLWDKKTLGVSKVAHDFKGWKKLANKINTTFMNEVL
jgi:hypothetical protein